MIDLKNGKYRDLKKINQGLAMIRIIEEQIVFQKSIGNNYENSALAQVLQSLLDKSKTVI